MGQRHQIFIVARVQRADKPAQYRCIVALHHQWCYGSLPLSGANGFKRLAQRKDNAFLIQQEIASYPDSFKKSARFPCPYTSFLAECAFSTDISKERLYISRIHVQEANMGSNQGDNNDGITVIDVTVPQKPAYCFVSVRGLEAAVRGVPRMTPLTATQYLRAYYPLSKKTDANEEEYDGELKAWHLKIIADMDDVPVVKLETLQEVWKTEYGSHDNPEIQSHPATEGSSESGPEEDTENILFTLRKQPHLAAEDLSQLVAVLKSQPAVDLSGLSLTSTQVLSVLADLGDDVLRLDVSGNTGVDKDLFVQILKAHKSLKRINLHNCSVSVEDLKDILTVHPELFHHLEAILHPAFVTSGRKGIELPNAFRAVSLTGLGQIEVASVSLPFFTTDQVIQNITDLLDFYTGSSEDRLESQTSTNLAAIFASPTRDQDQDWRDRDVHIVPDKVFRGFQGRGYNFLFRPGFRYLQEPDEYGIMRFKKQKEGWNPSGFSAQAKASKESEAMEIIDMATFLKELEEVDGRPPPAKADAAKRLVELCEGMTLITDAEAFLKEMMTYMFRMSLLSM